MKYRLRTGVCVFGTLMAMSGCFRGLEATRAANVEWEGRARKQIESEWGRPAAASKSNDAGQQALRWSRSGHRIKSLPSLRAELTVSESALSFFGALKPGEVQRYRTDVIAVADAERVLKVEGPSLRWLGPPEDANFHWGTVFGFHAGMSSLNDTSTALPGGGLYIGGMLSPTLALVGNFTLAAGSDDPGGAMGFAWGLSAQYWPTRRVWLRAGPAAILAFDPGFEDVSFEPGIGIGASFALVKSGTFVFDLRTDLVAGPGTQFGTVGIGVNLN